MKPRSILIVDDDQTIIDSLGEIFESEGYDVETATTGTNAMQKLANKSFDVTLLDIKLPDMQGTKLLEKTLDSPNMVKIMLTGYSTEEHAIKSLNLGANAYFVKPINPGKLVEAVENELKRHEEAAKAVRREIRKERRQTSTLIRYYK